MEEERVPPRSPPEEEAIFEFDAPSADISQNAWRNYLPVQAVHHAQGGLGSLGVYLVQLNQGGVIVVKRKSQTIAQEHFASLVFNKFGLKAPKMRPLEMAEFKLLTWAFRDSPVTMRGTGSDIHEPDAQKQGAVIMEYLHGKEILAIGDIENLLHNPLFLETLGKIVACDMLVNNSDRTNFIWRGQGNPGNILVTKQGSVCAIDQMIAIHSDNTLREQYMADVAQGAQEAFQLDCKGEKTQKLVDFLQGIAGNKETGFLQDSHIKAIHKGMTKTFAKFTNQVVLEAAQEVRQLYPGFQVNETCVFCSQVIDSIKQQQVAKPKSSSGLHSIVRNSLRRKSLN